MPWIKEFVKFPWKFTKILQKRFTGLLNSSCSIYVNVLLTTYYKRANGVKLVIFYGQFLPLIWISERPILIFFSMKILAIQTMILDGEIRPLSIFVPVYFPIKPIKMDFRISYSKEVSGRISIFLFVKISTLAHPFYSATGSLICST